GKTYNLGWSTSDTRARTHEMVESIGGNVNITNCGPGNNQLADPCGCWVAPNQVGGSYAAYWSAADGQCVVPEGWQGIVEYSEAPFDWTQVRNRPSRQIYSCQAGLIATDTNDNLTLYSGTPNVW